MILTTAKAWTQDLKRAVNLGPGDTAWASMLVRFGSYICFAAAGLLLWLGDSRSAFAVLIAVPIFGVGLIMFTCSMLLQAEQAGFSANPNRAQPTGAAATPHKDLNLHQTAAE